MYFTKEMQDTLALGRDGSTNVRRSKLTILSNQYEKFTMEENESVQSTIACIQNLLNSMRSLGTLYCNYDVIDKILHALPKKWRTQG